jgi:hypothetical protein
MQMLIFENMERFLGDHWGFIVLILMSEIVLYAYDFLVKKTPDTDYFRKLYFYRTKTRITFYLTMFLSTYILFFLPPFVLFSLLAIVIVYSFITKWKEWEQVKIGENWIRSTNLKEQENVKINQEKVKIEYLGLSNLRFSTVEQEEKTMEYSKIKEITRYTEELHNQVSEMLILNYRQDPEKAKEVFESLANELTQKWKDNMALENDEFKFIGITNTNVDGQGMSYGIEGRVKKENYEEIVKDVRFELAKLPEKYHLKMAEKNVYYRTRLGGEKK